MPQLTQPREVLVAVYVKGAGDSAKVDVFQYDKVFIALHEVKLYDGYVRMPDQIVTVNIPAE